MTAASEAGPAPAKVSRDVVQRYYLAMATPFLIDVTTSAVYVVINAQPLALLPMSAMSGLFLLLGVGLGARRLIQPIEQFIAGAIEFSAIERRLAALPRRSALLVAALYTPMLALRLLSPRIGITFGATIELTAWIDAICSFLVITLFNVVLTFFVVSAYLDRLCEHLFVTRGVNLATFPSAFRQKIGVAILFAAFAAMVLLAGDIMSYDGQRLIREASVDLTASVVAAMVTYYWITQALTRPISRLDEGMRRVSEGDLAVRLPVTSDDEIGRATSEFNKMVEGLAERRYLRDTFGKYVSESVAAAILEDEDRRGRVADTLAEATLMFTDIEGFTTLSEQLTPSDVARLLNLYYAAIVPVIQRHGGVVNNCIGDGLFASFNLPLPQPDHAAAAIRAAIEAQAALAKVHFPTGMQVRTRIGINTGTVVGVTIGTADWLNYTLLGDAVNIASRVEQLNKQFGTLILATESTVQAAGSGIAATRLGETDLRGHKGDVVVYRIDP
ncbi:MAG TPA: adenylate/guanylate cyclase domain-containing protein [Reyranella sp.]|nr:adenylate/guanylate cyclase domain-containing protein [Reyranella sp.]